MQWQQRRIHIEDDSDTEVKGPGSPSHHLEEHQAIRIDLCACDDSLRSGISYRNFIPFSKHCLSQYISISVLIAHLLA